MGAEVAVPSGRVTLGLKFKRDGTEKVGLQLSSYKNKQKNKTRPKKTILLL